MYVYVYTCTHTHTHVGGGGGGGGGRAGRAPGGRCLVHARDWVSAITSWWSTVWGIAGKRDSCSEVFSFCCFPLLGCVVEDGIMLLPKVRC